MSAACQPVPCYVDPCSLLCACCTLRNRAASLRRAGETLINPPKAGGVFLMSEYIPDVWNLIVIDVRSIEIQVSLGRADMEWGPGRQRESRVTGDLG